MRARDKVQGPCSDPRTEDHSDRRQRHARSPLRSPRAGASSSICRGDQRAGPPANRRCRSNLLSAVRFLPALVVVALTQSAEAGCQDAPGPRVDWTGCSRNLLMLGGDDLTGGVLTHAVLTSTDFRSAKLARAKLNEAELS